MADRLATLFVDPVYQNLSDCHGGALILATVAFAFQIYCDFGGYSDIARGCAKTMGIDLMVNFRAPYLAVSVTDFWRRWHISLTNWFREYVYIPLGGNRKGLWKKMLFVSVTFFLSGLWHGAAWSFVVWGLMQAVYLNIESLWQTYSPAGIPESRVLKAVSRLLTFGLCCFSWIFFRADSITEAGYVIRHSLAGITAPVSYCKAALRSLYPGTVLTAVILFSLLLLIPKDGTAPFLYFQF